MSLRIPVYRHGQPYESLESVELHDARSGDVVATIDQANPALVTRDLRRWPSTRAPEPQMMARILSVAADGLLEVDDPSQARTVAGVAATTGLTSTQVQAQMERLATALRALGAHAGDSDRLRPAMGFVLPSNAPGVHASWLTALALGHPVALKPGAREPWTPVRLAELLWSAGLPRAMLGLYPGDHATAQALIEASEYAILFGDDATVERYRQVATIDVRGPGRSKALLTASASREPDLIRALAEAVSEFGGRSCLNTSSIGILDGSPDDADALQRALNDHLRAIPTDELAAWPTREDAVAIQRWLAREVDAASAPELVTREDGLCALRPVAFMVDDWEDSIASMEAPCPWVAVTPIPTERADQWTRGALSVSVHGDTVSAEAVVRGLAGVDRVVKPGLFTTHATDIEHHVAALRALAP